MVDQDRTVTGGGVVIFLGPNPQRGWADVFAGLATKSGFDVTTGPSPCDGGWMFSLMLQDRSAPLTSAEMDARIKTFGDEAELFLDRWTRRQNLDSYERAEALLAQLDDVRQELVAEKGALEKAREGAKGLGELAKTIDSLMRLANTLGNIIGGAGG